MYSKWQLAGKYINFYLRASNGKGHGTHSPFIFHFITKILNDTVPYPEYKIPEDLRKKLISDQTILTIDDLGAGSAISKSYKRTISSIVKNSVKSKKIGQLLFRIVKENKPITILELGTSLGVTTSYLALANPEATVITMEGSKEVAAVAQKNFTAMQLRNIIMKEGNFDAILSAAVQGLPGVDLAFIDGNHRQEPTERYFQQLLSASHNDSVFIFDDIHWSREMEQAWENIKAHPSVTCTIDLFFIGIVFFRQEFLEKGHFSIRY
ncbi:MAG: class I SAM-dependent methyltransferase [Chitinophagaceae bacterium]|nr:class I SAM-dependent methyltransferase [Chitinophagaceae bacterium]